MAKINATYSSGYYLSHDTDYRKLEEEQAKQRFSKRKREGAAESAGDPIRQTFAMPFNVICLLCNNRISRGTHGYVNRRSTSERYLGIRVWELECRCIFCKGLFYLKTDYETAKITGGYKCDRFCRRGEGDYYGLNAMNEKLREQQEAEELSKKDRTLEALEKESEMMRLVQERQRLTSEAVDERADRDNALVGESLMNMIRATMSDRKSEQRQERARELESARDELQRRKGAEDVPSGGDVASDESDERAYRDFQQQMERMGQGAQEAVGEHAHAVLDDPDGAAAHLVRHMQARRGSRFADADPDDPPRRTPARSGSQPSQPAKAPPPHSGTRRSLAAAAKKPSVLRSMFSESDDEDGKT